MELSHLTYGSMRIERDIDGQPAARFLCELHDLGVDTHHSSSEYPNHGLYLDALARARATGRRFVHVVKLADPSFDADRFVPARFEASVDEARSQLGVDAIDVVQWLLRTPDPSDVAGRAALLSDQHDEIDATFRRLIASGKVRAFATFPYDVRIARLSVLVPSVSGLCWYLNLLETAATPFLEARVPLVAIRPVAAGRLSPTGLAGHTSDVVERLRRVLATAGVGTEDLDVVALRWPLLHPSVATVVVSLTGRHRVERAMGACMQVRPDVGAFDAIRREVADHRTDGVVW